MRSFPFPTGGRTGSRPDLRLRYFRVGGSLPMRDHAFLAGTVMDGVKLHAALPRDAARGRQSFQAIDRRAYHVVRIGRAQALGQDVANAGAFQHRAHRPTRDHAGSRGRRLEQDPARAVLADDLVRNRAAGQRNFGHVAARRLDGLSHRFADLVRLAGRDPDLSFPVADCDQSVEAEAPAALHDFRHAIDRDDVLDHAVALTPPALAVAPFTAAPSASAAATASATPPATALAARTARRPVLFHRRGRRGGRSLRSWSALALRGFLVLLI